MVQREQALYLPPRQGARIGLAGVALGSAISFGGLSGNDAEVLLPIPTPLDSAGGATRCRVQFVLRGDAELGLVVGETAATHKPTSLHSACAWVGPFAPPRGVPDEKLCWHGEVVSQPLTLRLCPIAASARTSASKAGPAAAAPTAMTAPKPTPMPRAPCWPRPGNTFGRNIGKDNAGDVAFGRNLSKDTAIDEARPTRKKALGAASRRVRSEQRAISNGAAVALLDGAAEDVADADTSSTRSQADKHPPPPPRRPAPSVIQGTKGLRLPSLSARSHASSQSTCTPRALADISSDPFDDPMLLELAEVVSSMRTANSTVVICTKRLKTRKGQHFVNTLRVRGHRILPAPDVRVFSTWAMAPRAFGQAEDLVMVADWQELYCCYDVLREASNVGTAQFHLLGAVALCERREEAEATAAAARTHLPCQWHVLPLLAF